MSDGIFGIADFIVFIGSLLVSLLVGVFFAIKDRRDVSTESYYFGGRRLSPILVGFSISVTFLSSITIIGSPTEVYMFGAMTLWLAIAMLVPLFLSCVYYIPLFHRLQLRSIYELLEMRFNKHVRMITSAICIFNLLVYLGISIYAPALALSAVTPIKLSWAIALTSIICTLYTTVGGVKAVIWTDAIQTLFIVVGVLSLFIRTLMMIGGWEALHSALVQSGRFNFFELDFDPTIRTTAVSGFVGSAVIGCVSLCANQAVPQRYLACKTVSEARKATIFGTLLYIFLLTLSLSNGFVMYAYFRGCDPLMSGKVAKPDQLAPYLTTIIFRDLPGFSGIFVAAAYSGTLSTVSSGINSLANLVLEDFVLMIQPDMSSLKKITLSKALVLLIGLLVTCLSYLTSLWGVTVLRFSFSCFGIFGAPVLGLFTLAVFVPWCNSKGALTGAAIGCISAAWIAVGGILHPRSSAKNRVLPLSIAECPGVNATILVESTTPFIEEATGASVVRESAPQSDGLYSISHWMYGVIGCFVTIIIALIVSFLTGANDPKEANPKIFMPLFDNKRLPRNIRKFFRFGVPELWIEEDDAKKSPLDDVNDAQLVTRNGASQNASSSFSAKSVKEINVPLMDVPTAIDSKSFI